MSNNKLGFPFQNYSIDDLINLSKRIIVLETNHGHSTLIIVNGDRVICYDKIYIELLCFIKFLSYFIDNYNMSNDDEKNVTNYVNNILLKVQEIPNKYLGFDFDLKDFIKYIDNNINEDITYSKETIHSLELIKKISTNKEEISKKATDLLELLTFSIEEIDVSRSVYIDDYMIIRKVKSIGNK